MDTKGPFFSRLLDAWESGYTLPFSTDASAARPVANLPDVELPAWYRELGEQCLRLIASERPEFEAIVILLRQHDQAKV